MINLGPLRKQGSFLCAESPPKASLCQLTNLEKKSKQVYSKTELKSAINIFFMETGKWN